MPSETYYQWREKLASGYYQTTIKRERVRKIDKAVLRQAVADWPDAFLKEYAEQFGCTATAVFYALEKLDITRKKNRLCITKKAKSARRNIRRG
ncbi:MAG: transposase [Treponema sp.]|nr:transposase [Treponema sp.]